MASSSYNFMSRHIKKGLIPAPGVRAKVRALNTKKKQNNKALQLDQEFKLIPSLAVMMHFSASAFTIF
jgi:hypothetical protein